MPWRYILKLVNEINLRSLLQNLIFTSFIKVKKKKPPNIYIVGKKSK